MSEIDFTEALIREYAQKIYGFAYSKTNNFHDAEDLSQEIIASLCSTEIEGKQIESMDAYIYRICFYTWSKYLRKNKPQWNAVNNSSLLDLQPCSNNFEDDLLEQELRVKLRQEIMYLSKIKREITVMFYYDNKKGDEIATSLGISASTVRWHLSKAKEDLRERVHMNETAETIYKPVRFKIGHDGWVQSYDMNGLQNDVLMHNICWICYGKALTIEDIARTIGVASVYLEDKIDKLLYMDYVKRVGTNKFQTNFFIHEHHYFISQQKFIYEHTLPLALPLFNTLKGCLAEVKKVGFTGAGLDDDMLMYSLLPMLINKWVNSASYEVAQEKQLHYTTPKRKDGSEHWVYASLPLTSTSSLSEELMDFITNSTGCGVKTRNTDQMYSLQYDFEVWGGWRDFDAVELSQLNRIYEITMNRQLPNSYDKEIIANLVQKGYVEMNGNTPKILVPYFKVDQFEKVRTIINAAAESNLNKGEYAKPFQEYIDVMKQHIPTFIDNNERNFVLMSFWPHHAIIWMLNKRGLLRNPTKAEQKRICTIVWETK